MNRVPLLVFGLLGLSGFWLANHGDEARLARGIDEPSELRAVRIAQTDYCLGRIRTNRDVIRDHMEAGEEIEVIGWRAQKKTERLYVVEFSYKEEGTRYGYYFEVDVGSTVVRNIEAYPELVAKYGIKINGR